MEIEKNALQNKSRSYDHIIADPERTLPALIFSSTGRFICKITGRKSPLPWQYNLAVLALVVQLPTLFISILFKEFSQWKVLGLVWMGYIELGLSASVIARLGMFYLFKNVKKYIVKAIRTQDDLNDLQEVLRRAWTLKSEINFTLVFTLLWCVAFSLLYSIILKQFIGFGLLTGTIVFGLLMGPALSIEWWFFIFIIHVGYYNYQVNETSPVHSEIIHRLSRTLTIILYLVSIFIAFGTLVVAFNPIENKFNNVGTVLLATLIGWIPTIVYFAGSQISMKRIVTSAKWKTLNHIQEKIRTLNKRDITDKKNIEAINRLLDYHERIRATPDSTLSLGTGLNFVNQLALPFIGLVLANIDKLIDFFR